KAPLPVTPGTEAAGIISATATLVSKLRVHDPAGVILPWTTGTCAEEILLHERQCVKLQRDASRQDFIDFVALGSNYQTAYFALVHRAPISDWLAQTLLILGAAGGAGVAALDIGKVLGAIILACASTQSKRDVCYSRGADIAIDYSRRGWQ
ncbi:hypothetical protein AURANDRAFT_33471, partial [Aureococcus anophagefferens]